LFLTVLSLISAVASEAQNIAYSMKMQPHQRLQAPRLLQVSNQAEPFTTDDDKAPKVDRPPLSGARVIGEVIAGGIMGWGLGLGGGAVGSAIEGNCYFCFTGVLIGFAIAYPVGTALGVYTVGNIGDETGSFWAAWGGCLIGGVLGFGLAAALGEEDIIGRHI